MRRTWGNEERDGAARHPRGETARAVLAEAERSRTAGRSRCGPTRAALAVAGWGRAVRRARFGTAGAVLVASVLVVAACAGGASSGARGTSGPSGEDSADSAIDAKGNNWLIEDNVVSETDARWDKDGEMRPSEFADGYQTHSVYDGYGTGNVLRRNRVEGAVPGFGIGLYPRLDNVVTCDNQAPNAAEGLVGDNRRPARCTPAG